MRLKKYTYLFLLPVIFVLVFFYYPLFGLLIESLKTNNGIGLSNYYKLFQSDLYINVFFISLKISFTVSLIVLLLSYPVAYFLLSINKKIYEILIYIIILPFWTSILVRSFAWQIMLQKNGIINSFLLHLGLVNKPLALSYSFFSVITGMVYIFIPYMVLILLNSFKNIDINLLQVGQTLGANRTASFLKIFLPLSKKGVAMGFTFVFLLSLGYFITPALLGGAKETMIAMIIDIQMNKLLDWGLGAAISFSLTFIIITIIIIIYRFTDFNSFNINTFDK